jgi:DNA polymerase III sliding clamp (beta) subunit (PCNA family)
MTTVSESKILTDTIEVESKALIELLEGALTHSSKDKSLRSLYSVQLESVSGYLLARSTDRYRLIEGRIEIESGDLSTSLVSTRRCKESDSYSERGQDKR